MVHTRIALFASGNGSNALNIIDFFSGNPSISIAFVLSNKPDAPVLRGAAEKGVRTFACSNEEAADEQYLLDLCQRESVDYVILAGYLRKVPAGLIAAYPERILNIHPSLLPKFGGKGMYGSHVHRAVLDAGETESGITVHLVNEEFDRGTILAQFRCEVTKNDTVESLQQKIQYLEHRYFPEVIAKTIAT